MNDDNELVWKALADRSRRKILDLLKEGPKTTGVLCKEFTSMSRFGVMKHIAVLEKSGLILQREQGREVWHYLNAAPIRQIYDRWISTFQDQWAVRLKTLKEKSEK